MNDNDFEWIEGPEPNDYDWDYDVLDFKGTTVADCCSHCKSVAEGEHERDCIMLYDNWCDDPDCDICQEIVEVQNERQ